MREGSPIADLYTVCDTCTCLQSELRGVLLEAHEVRRRRRSGRLHAF